MSLPLTEDQLLAAVQAEQAIQSAIHSPTVQPTTRLGVAAQLPRVPQNSDDPLWEKVPSLGSFFMHRPSEGLTRDVEARAAFTDDALVVRVVAQGHPLKKSFVHEFWMIETIEIFVDAQNDHYNYFQFVLMPDGKSKSSKCWKSCGTQRWEVRGNVAELSEATWQGSVSVAADSWAAQFVIPFAMLGGKPAAGKPLGFNVLRSRCEVPWRWYYWNFTHRGIHSPWGFGDLYLGAAPFVHVEKADLGELRLWDNRGVLHLRNLKTEAQTLRLDVTVKTGQRDEKMFYSHSQSVELPAHVPNVAVPFHFPFDTRDWKYHALFLTLSDKSGARIWEGAYRVGYETGWMLHIDDRREGPPVPNPAPGDSDFAAKKRAYIIRRLPKFVRATTTQGAPSDFTLNAADGSVQFDLMRAGALQRIADYIFSRYDNDLDRLLGATFFIHQHALVAYAHVPTSIATRMSPLSIIRLGNAQCGSQNEALCGLLEKMICSATKAPYRTRTVTYFAHVVAVAEFDGKWVQLDASLGRFYFLPGNTVLASMEELIANPSLAEVESPHIIEMLRKSQNSDLPFYAHTETGIWPPGAPEE
jgi:hypothetical protein